MSIKPVREPGNWELRSDDYADDVVDDEPVREPGKWEFRSKIGGLGGGHSAWPAENLNQLEDLFFKPNS